MAEIGFVEKIKGFLVSPVETFRKVKDEDMGPGIKYFIILALIFSILFAVIFTLLGAMVGSMFGGAFLGGMIGGTMGIVMFIPLFFGLLVSLFIGSAILHLFVYLVGGRKGYTQTLKAYAYGSTPMLLLGWILPISFVFSIWSLIVEILGIRELHEISTGRAVLAVILLIIVLAIIIAIPIVLLGTTKVATA